MEISLGTLVRTSLLAAAFSGAAAFGQEITGAITGAVLDPSGSGVPGAKVTVTNTDRNAVVRTTTTASDGAYSAESLDPGRYSVSATASDFKTALNNNIVLNINDRLTLNLHLEVGDVEQKVSVESAPVQVQLQTGEQSTVVNGTQIREQALITRNYEQLVQLMPGVSSASVDQLYVGISLPSGATATIPYSINGVRNSASVWLVDGADNIDRGSNLTLLTTPSIDAIAEFKVNRSDYRADLGRAAGAQISVLTKSGTNEFHGDLYEFVRNSDFAANNFYSNATSLNVGADGKAQVAPLHYNNFGWTLGGPIIVPRVYDSRKLTKHQTFFFVSEEFRRVITYTSAAAIAPTTGMLNGAFPTPVCVQYSGSTCTMTSTTIPNIDPVAKEYIADIFSRAPLSANSTTLPSLFRNTYDFEQEIYKLDHVFSNKLQLSGRFQRDQIPTIEPTGLFSTGETIPGIGITSTNAPGRTWVARATFEFSPTWVNEIGWSYSYGAIISNPVGDINSAYSPDIKTNLAFPATLSRVPTLAFAGGTSITGYGPYRDYNRNHEIFDNMTKILGDHTLKFGAIWYHYQKKENNAAANAGTFTFTPASVPAGTTMFNQAFANFLLGNVASFSQASEDVTPDVRAQQFEIYAQDDWRVRGNFTLNLGLRYSNFRQPTDANHELTNFDPALYNPANAPALTPDGLLANSNANTYLNGIIINGRNSPFGSKVGSQGNLNFGPRLGFAWDPYGTGKTAVRGGYGIFFDSALYGIYELNIFGNPPFVNNVTITNTTLDNPAGGTSVANSPKNLYATPVNFQAPYNQQWSLEVQREIVPGTIVNFAYVGSKGTHLLGTLDLNELPPGLAYSSGLMAPGAPITSANTPALNLLRPYVGYAAFAQQIEPWFNSNYNALQLYAQKHFNGDSLVTLSYTFSHNLTDNQTDRSTAPQNRYNFDKGEYGPAQYDRAQVFNVNFVYTLPFFREQHGIAGKALGGWELAGIGAYYTGLPYTATTSGSDPAGLGIIGASAASLRPNLVCDPNTGFIFSRSEGFNTGCFMNPAPGSGMVGNEGRGVIRGPGYEGWSFSASKNVTFGPAERLRVQLRGEASNAFNHTNPSTFGSLSNTSTLFGQITGYRDPRIIQLGAKLYF